MTSILRLLPTLHSSQARARKVDDGRGALFRGGMSTKNLVVIILFSETEFGMMQPSIFHTYSHFNQFPVGLLQPTNKSKYVLYKSIIPNSV